MGKNKGSSTGKVRRRKNEFRPEHTADVTPDAKARILQLLKSFKHSNQLSYKFDASLGKQERAMVHLLCRKMGLTSKSYGQGDERYVTVERRKLDERTKQKRSKTLDEKKKSPGELDGITHMGPFAFSEESRRVLMDLFMHYPPGQDHSREGKLNEQTESTPRWQQRRDDIFVRPLMSKDEITKKVESLAHKVDESPKLKEVFTKRSKLPIASFQDVITSTVANHQVVLICGETGCGKTTQVPQYILDHMWAKGESCKIVCTQPRRISAITVSERISQERGEKIGETVGYKIRLEAKGGRQSSIVFCTSGILLRVLVSSRESQSGGSHMKAEKHISEITHIVVDEIHERDRYSDFMLTIIRDLLPAYPDLRLVLMSATIDAERFSEYFGGCPIIRVPGFTHPVKSFYLEDVLSILKTPDRNHLNATTAVSNCSSEGIQLNEEYRTALDQAIEMCCSTEEFDSLLELISSEGKPEVLNYQHSSTGVTPLMVFAGKGRVGDICTLLSLGVDCHVQARDGSTALDWAKRRGHSEAAKIIKQHIEAASSGTIEEKQLLKNYMANVNPELIDFVLIERLLTKVCTESKEGAILVFLPGWEDISRTQKALLSNPFFKDSPNILVLPLHSMVPSSEQKKVFQKPRGDCRKIILSTNIAETSITIDDVVYVIDTGRLKEKSYDPYTNVSTLQSTWISKASAKQREGRAGRCQPGVCYHLYSKLKAVSLADFQVPEIKRMPIEELCLQVKMLDPKSKVEDFLKKTLDPPLLESINNAITVLQDIGALSVDEELTEIGRKLGSLPVHPLTSRMLFFSILLNCLDPALTLACAADYRDPFILPMLPDDKNKADVARAKLASLYGGDGDQLATVAAFECWKSARSRGREWRFCSEYFVSPSVMSMLSGMRKQLLNELTRGGFVPDDVLSCSVNARDPAIVRAVIIAGLYPRLGRMLPHGRNFMVETGSGNKARLLARSLMSRFSSDELFNEVGQGPLLVVDEVTRGDAGLQVRSCTVVAPLPLLLLAKEIAVVSPKEENKDNSAEKDDKLFSLADGNQERSGEGDMGILRNKSEEDGESSIMNAPDKTVTVVVDGWISFTTTALEVAQIYCLRERLSAAILFKISNPRKLLPPLLGGSIYAVACLLAYDGLKGNSTPKASPVDIFASLTNAPEVQATNLSRLSDKADSRLSDKAGSRLLDQANKADSRLLDKAGRKADSRLLDKADSVPNPTMLKDHPRKPGKYLMRSKARHLKRNHKSSSHARGEKKIVQGESQQGGKEDTLPVGQTKSPAILSPQEAPNLGPLVSVQPTSKKRKRKNKSEKQAAASTPSVKATNKKRTRKNKSKASKKNPAGAGLPPAQTTTRLVEQLVKTTVEEKPISGSPAKPNVNPAGLSVLVDYGSNHFGPYGPRGK